MISVCPTCGARYRGKLPRCPFDGATLTPAGGELAGLCLGERFELGELIGAGAVGVVYHAVDRASGAPAAVKILHRDLATSRMYRERFLREARAAMRVVHPAIGRILAVGESESTAPWLAMPFYAGSTLRRLLEHGALALERAASIATTLAAGLSVAHGAGVVHRDVKPANIVLLAEHESPVIFDFGLASVQGEPGLTDTGEVLGTPFYMSPEQVRGEPACPAMDQYALGCVWFELVTGQPPFVGRPAAILDGHATGTPPNVATLAPRLPTAQANVIMQLLDKSTEERALAFARLASGLVSAPA
ncbi:MAG: serine/threonine-protein kinase [Polyangiaceae bacterium]